MTDIKLTKKLLTKIGACKEGIVFLEKFNLDGIPMSVFDNIVIDDDSDTDTRLSDYIDWVKNNRVIEVSNDGKFIVLEDISGTTYEYTFDDNDNIVKEHSDYTGLSVVRTLDNDGNLIKLENLKNGKLIGGFSNYYENGLLVKTKDDDVTTEYIYNNKDQVIKIIHNGECTQENEYDDNGNLTHIKSSNIHERFISYDDNGNVVKEITLYVGDEYRTDYTYNNDGLRIRKEVFVKKQNTGIWEYVYDDHKNEIEAYCNGEIQHKYDIEYYSDGQLKSFNGIEIPFFEK